MNGEAVRRTVRAGAHRVSYLEAGPADGPPLVLIHGLASDATTWDRAITPLAGRGLRVVAVDLIGHGHSDKPRGPYLLDDFTQSLHDLLGVLQIPRATLCGHSLGGAIAVHFGYHFPDETERLVLVSAGGLGREVHLVLRAAALPGASAVLGLLMRPRLQALYRSRAVRRSLRSRPDSVANLRRAGLALGTAEGRAAFLAALRGVIAPSGQRGSFIEMLYLAQHVPTLVIWSEHDPVIPVAHAHAVRRHLSSSELVIFPGGGHEPHRRHAQAFAQAVADFVGR